MEILIKVENGRVISARVLKYRDQQKTGRAVKRAISWLNEFMAAGPRQSAEIFLEASDAGINRATLYRAKQVLGIRHFPVGYRACDGWTWELRDDKQTDVAHDTSRNASPMDQEMETFIRLASRNGIESREESGIGDDCNGNT